MTDRETFGVELGDVARQQCVCCGRESETVHGYLYDTQGETTVYFAGYAHGHPERRANMLLSLGGWGEGGTPGDRRSIAIEVVVDDRGKRFIFPAAETSPWYGEAFLGLMLDPEQLSQDERARFSAMARLATERDPRVAGYLDHG